MLVTCICDTAPLALRLADFWLSPNYSAHGESIDKLFAAIAWLTVFILLAVQATLVVFLIRYRHRPEAPRATFTHGNLRVETIWTVIPAAILLVLAMVSKRVWDNYRYSPDLADPKSHHVLVVGQQFRWNAFYAGADNKLGQYLAYPRPTDAHWPRDAAGRAVKFRGVDGPADLPMTLPPLPDKNASNGKIALTAQQAVNEWVAAHPFGKVDDPALEPYGADDYVSEPDGVLTLPVGETTVIDVASKDVIHDFYLPNFRVNVYAVPGMRVQVALRPMRKSSDFEEHKLYDLDDLAAVVSNPSNAAFAFDIDETSPGELGKNKDMDRAGWRYFDRVSRTRASIIRNGRGFPQTIENGRYTVDPAAANKIIAALKAAGLAKVRGYVPFYWEIECAQLCGVNHTEMEGKLYVIDAKAWAAKYQPPAKPRVGIVGEAR